MIRYFKLTLAMEFIASPGHSMLDTFTMAGVFSDRRASTLVVHDPGFPRDDPPMETPVSPSQFPTDVPAAEPHDVPPPTPRDVPPSEPRPDGEPRRGEDLRPRPIP